MTNKAVSNVNGLAAGFQVNSVGRCGSNLAADSFSSVMQKTTGKNQPADNANLQQADAKKPEVQSSTEVMKDNNTKTAKQIEEQAGQAADRTKEEALNGAKDAVNETAKKVVEKVADILGISVEEVEQAMETLGLTAVNLLDSENLANLMLNLSGETDRMAFVTNEMLSTGMRDVLQMIQSEMASVKEIYHMDDAQLQQCMDALTAEKSEDAMPVFDVRKEETAEELNPPKEAVVTLSKNGEEVKVVVETDAKTGASTITQESAPLTGQEEESADSEKQGSKGEQNGSDSSRNGNLVLQNLTQNSNTVTTVQSTETTFAQTEQTQDIMNQILDYMKVQIKPETTSLEMQLHPENLGTLNIHIAQKNGMLTAQFTTQNEAVKNVIEAQLVTLQQNLNEQGVKVEAVEVNVATQQFNRNLDQGQGSHEHSSEEAKKKQPRRINLNNLDAFAEEELEEEDQVTADMMARNGNTVDYLA